MRSVLILLFLLGSLGRGGSDTFVHWRGDYEAARHEAVQTGKRLLLVLVKKPAVGRRLLGAIRDDLALSEKISQRCVAVLVTVYAKARYPIELYYTMKFPAVFLVDAKHEIPLGTPCIGESLGCLRRKLLPKPGTNAEGAL